MIKTIIIGSDHNGFDLKPDLITYLQKQNYQVIDVSNQQLDPDDDFPIFADKACHQVLTRPDAVAILICGGGQGMCMAANRHRGIRASVLWDSFEAKMTRNDNDANICCLPARIMTDKPDLWQDVVDTFLKTDFADAPRFRRRNQQLDNF